MKPSSLHTPEILAPAGNRESLIAAVRSGADAVYFGTSEFNARRNAENFTPEEFAEAVSYCRVRGVKVFVTLNTLITDAEKDAFLKNLRLVADSGANAVIVQDMGAAALIKRHCPSLTLHASTQMAVHNVSGALLLEEMGFERIVLARENSFEEIKKICSSVKAETEVFVHGAMCMSASGMCYMSSALGGRSGNRGLCAQPCRLNFTVHGREHALSLKDMSLIEHVGELAEAGVTSLKIEGRMKRPEYVAGAVNAVKTALRGEKPDIKTLRSVFSRSGFTDGYFTGQRNLSMFGCRRKEDVTAAADVIPSLHALYKDEIGRVPVSMDFTLSETDSRLILSDGTRTVQVSGNAPEKARTCPLTSALAQKQLTKLGSTPYRCEKIECTVAPNVTLSASSLNSMRRDAAEKLTAMRAQSEKHVFFDIPDSNAQKRDIPPERSLRLRFEKAPQIPKSLHCERIILPAAEIEAHADRLTDLIPLLAAEIPPLVYPTDEERTEKQLANLSAMGIKYSVCENIGAVELSRRAGLIPTGGHMLNILNSESLKAYYRLGVTDCTLSSEMSFEFMKKLSPPGKIGFIAYGLMPLMRFRCCPAKKADGCSDCKGRAEITDRRGEKFPLLCSSRRFSTLLNPVPLCTASLNMPPADFVTLYFTVETQDECERITEAFRQKQDVPGKKTSGLYCRALL